MEKEKSINIGNGSTEGYALAAKFAGIHNGLCGGGLSEERFVKELKAKKESEKRKEDWYDTCREGGVFV